MTVLGSAGRATPESPINRAIPGKPHLPPLRVLFSAELSTETLSRNAGNGDSGAARHIQTEQAGGVLAEDRAARGVVEPAGALDKADRVHLAHIGRVVGAD